LHGASPLFTFSITHNAKKASAAAKYFLFSLIHSHRWLQLLPQKIGEATQFLSKLINDILVVICMEAKKEETKKKNGHVFPAQSGERNAFSCAKSKNNQSVTLSPP